MAVTLWFQVLLQAAHVCDALYTVYCGCMCGMCVCMHRKQCRVVLLRRALLGLCHGVLLRKRLGCHGVATLLAG